MRTSKAVPKTKIGWFLKEQRELLNFTQAELAAKLGIQPKTYNGYEVGGKTLSKKSLDMVANFYKVENTFLLPLNQKEEKLVEKQRKIKEKRKNTNTNHHSPDTSNIRKESLTHNKPETLIKTKNIESSKDECFKILSLADLIDQLKTIKDKWNTTGKPMLTQQNIGNLILIVKNYEVVVEIDHNFIMLAFINENEFISKMLQEYLGDPFLNIPRIESQNSNRINAGYSIWVNNNFSNTYKLNILFSKKPETLLTIFQDDALTQLFLLNMINT
ncbi:helix-turn-helix transcriptional regulator [Neobacillus sp. PS3-40]|uniref:helix-turn-helix domain-containing protein n=1 Tax=Neobacillus sp. PS3-40 TaxID=3070679 RepID=UPI0027E0C697|nr:helix-turn-helix transcriptional regulator [Neobacillus sp. PS3-40]WML46165.1 helix-turn-helix transcriptional regulator [Neobacillus sp. PS3-40]